MKKNGKKPGTVWLIGAGPGAKDLVSGRADAALGSAEVILYDDLVSPALLPEPRTMSGSPRIFVPVGKRGSRGFPQVSIEKLLVRFARQGKTVARLKGGDPFVLGRGGEEVDALRKARIPYEVIPGISSATGVPTLAGIPLTHRGVAASFTVVTGHLAEGADDREPEWDLLAHATDTLVIMMGVATFKRIAARLIKAGKDPETPVAVIRWGSWPMEHRQIGTLADGEAGRLPVGTPSVIVIGAVVRFAEPVDRVRKPEPHLAARIAITGGASSRSHAMMSDYQSLLERNFAIRRLPLIHLTPVLEFRPLRPARRMLEGIREYDWVVLTSATAVGHLESWRERYGIHRRAMLTPKFAVVGPATATALASSFCPPDAVATNHRQEGLVEVMGDVSGKRILFPCAAGARDWLPTELRRRGATVDVLPLYRTVPDRAGLRRLSELVRADQVDVITFASGSAVRFITAALGASGRRKLAQRRILAASIGPVTSAELRKHGIRPPIEARKASMEELVSAIARYYAKHPHAPRLR